MPRDGGLWPAGVADDVRFDVFIDLSVLRLLLGDEAVLLESGLNCLLLQVIDEETELLLEKLLVSLETEYALAPHHVLLHLLEFFLLRLLDHVPVDLVHALVLLPQVLHKRAPGKIFEL